MIRARVFRSTVGSQVSSRRVRVVRLLAGAPVQNELGVWVVLCWARLDVRGGGGVVQYTHAKGIARGDFKDVATMHRTRIIAGKRDENIAAVTAVHLFLTEKDAVAARYGQTSGPV